MIIIENLHIHSTIDLQSLIDGLWFTLNKGDKAAIIGEEGNGKSTLLKLLYFGDCTYAEHSGNFSLKGKVCYLAQELDADTQNMTVHEFFASQMDVFDMDIKQAGIFAKQLGFETDIFWSEKRLFEFSGGEKVKIQLLNLALSNADVYLLDEPSNDIDINTLEWLENFICTTNAVFLYVSHDQTLLEKTANVIIHLEQSKKKSQPKNTVFRGGYSKYTTQRQNLLMNQQQLHNKQTQQFNAQKQKFLQIFQAVEHAQNTVSPSDPATGSRLKKKMHSVKALEKRLDKKQQSITPKVDVEQAIDLKFGQTSLPKGKIVANICIDKLKIAQKTLSQNIQFTAFGGEKIAIIGQNGCGKTTLIKQIYQNLKHRSDINVGYMPQNYADQMDFCQTAVEFLANTTGKDKTFVRSFLGSSNFTAEEMLHQIGQLSGGQKAKLYILSMILQNCNCLILDEPTRNFSPLSTPVIISNLASFDGTIIAVSHDRSLLKIFDKVLTLTPKGLLEN